MMGRYVKKMPALVLKKITRLTLWHFVKTLTLFFAGICLPASMMGRHVKKMSTLVLKK
jgi:hypothetical protein